MIDRDQFRRHVQDALAHLYDALYLREHPLARLAAAPERPGSGGSRLTPPAAGVHPAAEAPAELPARHLGGLPLPTALPALHSRQVDGRDRPSARAQRATTLPPSARRDRRPHDHTLWRRLTSTASATSSASQPGAGAPVTGQVDAEDYQSEVDRLATGRSAAPVDLGSVLRGAVATVEGLTRSSGQAIRLDEEDRPFVSADRATLRQAVLGLLVSAIGLSSGGEIRVEAHTETSGVTVRLDLRARASAEIDRQLDEDSDLRVSRRLLEHQGATLNWLADGSVLSLLVVLPIATLGPFSSWTMIRTRFGSSPATSNRPPAASSRRRPARNLGLIAEARSTRSSWT